MGRQWFRPRLLPGPRPVRVLAVLSRLLVPVSLFTGACGDPPAMLYARHHFPDPQCLLLKTDLDSGVQLSQSTGVD